MPDLSTQAAKFGDSDNTLLFKMANYYWGVLTVKTGLVGPQFGDTNNTLLRKICQYLDAF